MALAGAPPAEEKRVKPRWRGVSHRFALLVLAPAVVWLLARAKGGPAFTGIAIYGASVVLLFATSSLYHGIHWPERQRAILGRIDHAAIFLLIAGTYTPFGLALGTGIGLVSLGAIWLGALLGIALVVRGIGKRLRSAIYVGLGWVIVPVAPALFALLGPRGLALICAGGLLYTGGAVIYALRRPDPLPRVFGFHEIFHLLVIAAAACHFIAVEQLVS